MATVAQIIAGRCGFGGIPAGSTRDFTDAKVGEGQQHIYVPVARRGRFRSLRVVAQGAPGAGQSWTFTLQKLSSNAALTCTISGSASNEGIDFANTVVFEDGERWCLKVVSSAGAPADAVRRDGVASCLSPGWRPASPRSKLAASSLHRRPIR